MLFAVAALALAAVAAPVVVPGSPGLHHPVQGAGYPGVTNVTQHSGYVTVNGTYERGSHLFYWFFGAEDQSNNDLVIWLSGGPGCASTLAQGVENGPVSTEEKDATFNKYGWNQRANLIYIDQPVGTGFSYADHAEDMCTNEKCVGKQLVSFILGFFQQFPQYKENKIHLFAESYGGHYAPAFSYAMYESNQAGVNTHLKITNVGIGDGLVDAAEQYRAYADFANSVGALSGTAYGAAKLAADACVELILHSPWEVAMSTCNAYMASMMEAISAHMGFQINPYDYKIKCQVPGLCYDFSNTTNFYNRADVQKSLGAKPQAWQSCNMEVHSLMMDDWMTNLEVNIPTMLDAGINFYVYEGLLDFIVNYFGALSWTTKMQWSGASAFAQTKMAPWHVNGQVAGTFRQAVGSNNGQLSLIYIDNAGHLAPHDTPVQTLSMLDTVIFNDGKFK